jgi:hypothetical protein
MQLGRHLLAPLTALCCLLAAPAAALEKRILDCTSESVSLADCNRDDYLYRIVAFAAPGIIIVALLAVSCPTYCLFKYVCNCCGGRNQSPNFCCVDATYPARYSKWDLQRPKALAIFFFLMGGGALTWGYFGAAVLQASIVGFEGALANVPVLLQGEIAAIDAALVLPVYDATTDTISAVQAFKGSPMETQAKAAKEAITAVVDGNLVVLQEYVNQATLIVTVAFCAPVGVMFIGLVCAVCNCRRFVPMAMVWLLFASGVGMWTAHAVFGVGDFVFGDICVEVAGLKDRQRNLVSVMMECEDGIFAEFRTSFKAAETAYATLACMTMRSMCYDATTNMTHNLANNQLFVCPASLDCSGITYEALVDAVDAYMYQPAAVIAAAAGTDKTCATNSTAGCSITGCMFQCTGVTGTLGSAATTSKSFAVFMYATQRLNAVFATIGTRFSTCDSIMKILISPMSEHCGVMAGGLVTARRASALEGLAILAFIFICAWGAKRNLNGTEAMEPQEDGVRRFGMDGDPGDD